MQSELTQNVFLSMFSQAPTPAAPLSQNSVVGIERLKRIEYELIDFKVPAFVFLGTVSDIWIRGNREAYDAK